MITTTEEHLSEILHGSTITVIAQQEKGKLELGFDDGIWLEAKTEPGTVINAGALAGGVVDCVHQGAHELSLQLESGESIEISTVDEHTSVLVPGETDRLYL